MDILNYNSKAWDKLTESNDKWTLPVDEATIAEARKGHWAIQLTSLKPAPRSWFPETLEGLKILCLASGGGQQGPIFAAAGADVTVLDSSAKQLAQDRFVAEREGLDIKTVQGDMKDLSSFPDESFDLVVNPCSNLFSETVLSVWKESARVLKPGGTLMSGFLNPLLFIFDLEDYENGKFTVRHKIPFSDTRDLPENELKKFLTDDVKPVCFGHTLHDQIQGQIDAGLVISGFYEDGMGDDDPLNDFIDVLIATRAVKIKL
jgi:ubiquinone/menaquinone biosynthesis C-methylase UbiE